MSFLAFIFELPLQLMREFNYKFIVKKFGIKYNVHFKHKIDPDKDEHITAYYWHDAHYMDAEEFNKLQKLKDDVEHYNEENTDETRNGPYS